MAVYSRLSGMFEQVHPRASEPTRVVLRSGGFTLIEILLAMVLIAATVVPMMEAFSPGRTAEGGEEAAVFTNQVRATLSRITAYDFETLDSYVSTYGTGTMNLTNLFGVAGFSDGASEAALETFTLDGTSYTPVATITDASGGAGGLYEISVTIEYITLKTQKAEY